MSVRATEARLPAIASAGDLGEAAPAADGRSALVSFVSSPLAVGRLNTYVVFVTDAGLAADAASYEWTFAEDGGPGVVSTTTLGQTTYSALAAGTLSATVRILDSGNAELARLELNQAIVPPSAVLEQLIEDARNHPGPGVPDPEVSRELVNEHNPYYQAVRLARPEAGTGFARFVFTMIFEGAQRRTAIERAAHVRLLADSISDGSAETQAAAAEGIGVCELRLALLAMTTPRSTTDPTPLLAWSEMPESGAARAIAAADLARQVAALDPAARIDLFNLARFPKSGIERCARILEQLRDRYFPSTSFDDVLGGLSGTRAHWIVRHYREGPLSHR
ncbi:MAG: hypothetical protein QOE42_2237 [Chloroflexota bacterium]|jgi:hypothetical protein|nr:hypothetical protein [Chloroflexota bacterium]